MCLLAPFRVGGWGVGGRALGRGTDAGGAEKGGAEATHEPRTNASMWNAISDSSSNRKSEGSPLSVRQDTVVTQTVSGPRNRSRPSLGVRTSWEQEAHDSAPEASVPTSSQNLRLSSCQTRLSPLNRSVSPKSRNVLSLPRAPRRRVTPQVSHHPLGRRSP